MLEFRRVIANLLDFILIYAISYLFLSQENLTVNLIRFNFITQGDSLVYKHIVITILLLFFYRFYSAVFFSISFGQWLLGIRLNSKNQILVRICSSFRVVLFPIVFFVVIVDRYFKNDNKKIEKFLFGPEFIHKPSATLDLAAAVIFITSSVLFCLSPFLYFGPLHFNPKVSVYLKEDKKLDASVDFNLFKSYGARSLEFSTFSDLGAGRFKLNPSYELKRNNGKLIYRPIVSLWDKNLGVKGLFKINKRFDFYRLLLEVRENFFLFSSTYPNLNEVLNNYKLNSDSGEQLSDKAKRELFDIISTSLVATPLNITSLYKKGIFFYFPYLIFKEKLFHLMGKEADQSIDFVQKGEDLFLRTIYKDDFNESYRERFFTYNSLRPIIYEVIWQKNSYEKDISQVFNDTFFVNGKWGDTVLLEAKNWESDLLFNPISIVDFIGFKNFSAEGLGQFEKYLYDYFYTQAGESLKMSTTYQNLLIASMQRLFVVWQLKIKNDNIPFSKLTIKKFSDMIKALELRDTDYFRKK